MEYLEENETTASVIAFSAGGSAIYHVLLPIICTCGIVGIVLTIVVLSSKHMCTSTNCYLTALAVADLLFLLLLASILMERLVVPADEQYHNHFDMYMTYAAIAMQALLLASVWLTVVLGAERYIAICRPFLVTRLFTVPKARATIAAVFIVAAICRLPNVCEYQPARVYDTLTNTTHVYLANTRLAFNKHYLTIYPWLVDGLLSSVLPFCILLLLNARLIVEVRRSSQYVQRNLLVVHATASVIQREELQITVMLISIIVVFFVCQAPYLVYTAVTALRGFQPSRTLLDLLRVTQLLLTLKSALNFILYCWFSEKFWATLKRLFRSAPLPWCCTAAFAGVRRACCTRPKAPDGRPGPARQPSDCIVKSSNGLTRDSLL